MNISEALHSYSDIEVELMLSHVLGKPKEFLYARPEFKLTSNQFNNLTKYIIRRRRREPIAYILGYKYFYGLKFFVTPDVLIPRPESEWLVEKGLQRIKNQESRLRQGFGGQARIKVLDVGTGSGNIIISLAKNTKRKDVGFYAGDISRKALSIGRKNSRFHKVKIRHIQSNLFAKIPSRFDLIIANLPYVSVSDYKRLRDLKYEPILALTDGTNRWKIYQRFFSQTGNHLSPGGLIILEIDPKARPFINQYAERYLPRAKLSFFKDLQGLWRYAEIKI